METRHSGKATKAASSREKRRLDVANVVSGADVEQNYIPQGDVKR
jgi:hypothetical protein